MIRQESVISNSKPGSAVLYRGRCWKDSNNESLGSQWTTQTYLKHPANVPIHEGSGLETVKTEGCPNHSSWNDSSTYSQANKQSLSNCSGWSSGDSCPQQDYHEARRQTCISYHSLKEPLQWVSGGEPWETEINYTTTLKKDAFTIIIKVRYKWKKIISGRYLLRQQRRLHTGGSSELRLTYW